jgi:signal recognition particle subunit SRP54
LGFEGFGLFDTLSDRLGKVFDRLTGRGALTDSDVVEALREVRVALLEADVALPVVKDFIERVREKAVGAEVLRSVTPGQQVVKIVHDELVATLGADPAPLNLAVAAPAVIMMVGLQGSGKTTSTAKIAARLQAREKKKVLMASLDTRRPAAMEQLKVLGEQVGVATLPIIEGQNAIDIARRALEAAKLGGHDVLMLDTAGRNQVDEALMAEAAEVRRVASPDEVLLVADSLTGQDAVHVAESFGDRLGVSGIVLTRIDGDGRGGAALSMRAVTGKPIKLLGVGEKMDALEDFHPERIAGRILGMGDVVSLVEKAADTIDQEKAEKIARKMKKGEFDLDDLAEQLRQMKKLGGMQGILGLLPGMGKMRSQIADAGIGDDVFKHQEAIISSMTKRERRNPKVLNASRKKRVAAGSGTSVQEINRLLKMHRQMADMMKKVGRGGMKQLFGAPGAQLDEMPAGELPSAAPGMPGVPPGMPALPGLGGAGMGMPARGGKKKKRKK